MDGLLLIDKPKGWTSFDVVAKVRGIIKAEMRLRGSLRNIKVGHTGTLDPLATGLLVLAIGSYTKKVPELTRHDKTYAASVTLGFCSTTDDAEGQLTAGSPAQPTLQAITAALQLFVGEIQQIPPQFSAIKIGGVKSYDAARKGRTVTYEPRTVTIYSISDIKYTYPTLTFACNVGSGTYIRSLARDLGAMLKTGGYLSDLRRTKVGNFDLKDALHMSDSLDATTVEKSLLV